MQIVERRVYRGPSLYAHFPVMRLTLDLGKLEDWPSAKIVGFNDKLIAALPSLKEHTCSYGEAGGFVRRLNEGEGTWLGHVLEHVAIELQQRTGADVSFGKTRGAGPKGHYHVVYEYEEERVGEAAADLGIKLLRSCLPSDLGELPTDFDLK
jgi:cyanophycin synthetase